MWNLQDAKNRFSAVVDAALAGQPQEVMRRGKPAVVVLSAADYARMVAQSQSHRGSFRAHLLAQPAAPAPAPAPDRAEPRPAVAPRDVDF